MKSIVRSFVSLICLLFYTQMSIGQEAIKTSPNKQLFDSLFYQGVLSANTGKYPQAEEFFTQAYTLDSLSPALCFSMGKAIISQLAEADSVARQSRMGEVETWLGRGYRLAPLDLEMGNLYARVLIYREKEREAYGVLEDLIDKFPERDELKIQLMEVARSSDELTEATFPLMKQWLEKATDEDAVVSFFSEIVRISLEQKRRQDLLQAVRTLTERFSTKTNFRILGIFTLISADEYKEAAKQLKKLERISSDPTDKYIMRSIYLIATDAKKAYKYIRKGLSNPEIDNEKKIQLLYEIFSSQVKEAKGWTDRQTDSLVEELYRIYPQESDVVHFYILWCLQKEDSAYTEQAYQTIEQAPEIEIIYEVLLSHAIEKEDMQQVHRICDLSKKNRPLDHLYYLFDAIAYTNEEKIQQAISELQLGLDRISTAPGDTDKKKTALSQLYSAIGDLYYAQSDLDSTLNAYEKSLEAYDSNADVLNNYAYLLAERDTDLDKALRLIKKAYDLNPDNHNILDTYGYICQKKGLLEDAEKYYRMALKDPEGAMNSTIHDHLGEVLLLMGKKEEAIEIWQQALILTEDKKEPLRKKIRAAGGEPQY
ncbi:hypothetical protein HQ45_00010 [Porphyromonas crevioricanis]|uniref:Tetratricopeptide repeat protein n=2 Tax=Porphyromonas crevioricanis TaxID=393921 RepID=A0AB34PJQ4_9PORP|nr:tetratricopeptide repeat protein [Porphyromonas crevioricanis]KGN91217.1 hypothetical protein HQ45_00010 [Porphyromonas crevioricanis]KGN96316.1 hypothetical protein HQ38_02065 [Porphyromonas crevioricanis]GAD04557.1 FOG: TPR repeat [Porphyromonas crevioricanis JCM 15906]SJZ83793.1 Tetratricopeptide repeat-containing protein [Porphyromonas crevioricanis]